MDRFLLMTETATCSRCNRVLSAEKPVRLPDSRSYCMACCESMAADDFEMETGETFTKWIEKHPVLVMQYQPLELTVRKMNFILPLLLSLLGILVGGYGVRTYFVGDFRAGWIGLGVAMLIFFGIFSFRGARNYLRALNFKLTLEDGVFRLQHGSRSDTFTADDVTQACVVRPGTVGATEGALQLKDGRMLTLDTCLSDLHALGVVMDLRFREDFPPSADDIARVRREKLRKIRGLS
jgi:hypothetical protein